MVCRLGLSISGLHIICFLPLFVLRLALPKWAVDSKTKSIWFGRPDCEPGSSGHELYLGYWCLLDLIKDVFEHWTLTECARQILQMNNHSQQQWWRISSLISLSFQQQFMSPEIGEIVLFPHKQEMFQTLHSWSGFVLSSDVIILKQDVI